MTSVVVALLFGYWAEDHKGLNRQVISDGRPFSFERSGATVSTVNDYLLRVLYVGEGLKATVRGVPFQNDSAEKGTDRPTDRATKTLSLLEWNGSGGLWEDGFTEMSDATAWGGLRAVNHFHDPLAAEGGYTGIKTETGFTARWRTEKSGKPVLDLLRPGMAVTQWAEGGTSTESNDWGYPTVLTGLLDFGTKLLAEDRERGLAAAFRSLGQLQHLVADNTVPDHARDLAHPGDGFEEWIRKERPELFAGTDLPWPRVPLERVDRGGLRALWDQDLYSGSSPADGLAEGAGIAEFTQANFLAWNRFQPPNLIHVPFFITSPVAALLERDILYFTTVPSTTGVGFETMPWPRLTASTPPKFAAEAPGLQLPACIAKKKGSRNIIDHECWGDYALPLMKRAHGTAQTLLTLALPPLRAELVPEPGDLTRFRVRLWNLGSHNPGDAVALRLDKVSFSSVRFEGEALRAVVVAEPGGELLEPGASPWVSQPFVLGLTEQGILKASTYGGVAVEAHLGQGQQQTRVGVSVPIPNGFPVINQLTATTVLNAQTHGVNVQSNCCNTSCTQCGENAEYVQPLIQNVTGVISRHSSHLDMLGRPAAGTTRAAIDSDTRVAGVALLAWGLVGGSWDAPLRPVRSKLQLSSELFEERGAMWIRKTTAPDLPDPAQIDFSISLDASDFYGASAGSYTALQSVHLVVWMTSGASYVQNLALWPMRRPESVDVALAMNQCAELNTPRDMQYEVAAGCESTRSGEPTCSSGMYLSTVRTTLFGPLRGIGTVNSAYTSLHAGLELTQLGGAVVDRTGTAECPAPVTPLGQSYSLRCYGDYNSFILENVATTGTGACPTIPAKPQTPRTATMRPVWSAELKAALQQILGRADEPSFRDIELR